MATTKAVKGSAPVLPNLTQARKDGAAILSGSRRVADAARAALLHIGAARITTDPGPVEWVGYPEGFTAASVARAITPRPRGAVWVHSRDYATTETLNVAYSKAVAVVKSALSAAERDIPGAPGYVTPEEQKARRDAAAAKRAARKAGGTGQDASGADPKAMPAPDDRVGILAILEGIADALERGENPLSVAGLDALTKVCARIAAYATPTTEKPTPAPAQRKRATVK